MDGFFVHAPARRLAPARGFGKCRGAMVFHDPRPPAREPAFNLPPVVVQLLAVLVLIQAGRSLLSDYNDYVLMSWLAFVPARLTLWLSPGRLDDVVGALAQSTVGQDVGDRLQLVQLLLADGGVRLWTLLSYGFLHGSWLHLASNGLWLAAFGSPVARRLGPGRFLNLMALSTIGGALLHWWSRDLDVLPLVGASAGISGATAAAIRFVFAPGNISAKGYRTQLRLRDGKSVTFGNLSWRSLTDLDRDDARYHRFVTALAQAIAKANPRARFIGGKPRPIWLGMALVGGLSLAMIVFFALRAFQQGQTNAGLFALLLLAASAWQVWPLIALNRPRELTPGEVPDELVPGRRPDA